ncbi:MAG: heme exporter protein CcmB [Chloroflexota bacterium]
MRVQMLRKPVMLRVIGALLWKDLLSELRGRALLAALVVFALLTVVVFNYALDLERTVRASVGAGVLWVTIVFAATLALNRVFAAEREHALHEGLLLAPVERLAIYFGKLLSGLLFVLLVEAVVLPVFALLYDLPVAQPLNLAVLLLGTLGYLLPGTLLAALAAHARAREVLLPVLLFPVAMPVILSAVRASQEVLAGSAWVRVAPAFNLLVASDIIFLALAVLLFDQVVAE